MKAEIDMENQLILIDENDNITGYGEKLLIHKNGLLHRAFSVFIYNVHNQTILLQKRAENKYHSGGLWSNSCCSHQYYNENWTQALRRCISTELSICPSFEDFITSTTPFPTPCVPNSLITAGSFMYYSDYGEMKEHEIDHVFIWSIDPPLLNRISANPNEVSQLKWFTLSEIDCLLTQKPYVFTSWFYPAYKIAKQVICKPDRKHI